MTGAPKLRTVELIEKLEGVPRGPYSGVLGYFSLDGAAEFNVIIRSAVFDGKSKFGSVVCSCDGTFALTICCFLSRCFSRCWWSHCGPVGSRGGVE